MTTDLHSPPRLRGLVGVVAATPQGCHITSLLYNTLGVLYSSVIYHLTGRCYITLLYGDWLVLYNTAI